MEQYILALDQGTSSSRAIVFDHGGRICASAQKEFPQHFPKPGWVEHDPKDIWSSEASVVAEAITSMGINGLDIAGIGITNQRETTIVWDAETGEPVYNAIVWQDRRTSEYCDSLKDQGLTGFIREKTGLIIDAYFSATKIRWILNNVPGARQRGRGRKTAFRHSGYMADMESYERRMPRDRCQQRLEDNAFQHPYAQLGQGTAESVLHP